MAKVEMNLSVAEAETILTGLTWRLKQKGISAAQRDEIMALGMKVGEVFEKALNASPGWWGRYVKNDVQIVVKVPTKVYR